MSEPVEFDWIPDRKARNREGESTVDLLIKVRGTLPETTTARPAINLCLVIDRSGSMGGEKIALTRQAASKVVDSLADSDYLSLVTFDNNVDVVVPSGPVRDRGRLHQLINSIHAHGSTALYAGWQTGAAQALLSQRPDRLNRVVLLTDGQANVGETNPDRISDEVHRLAERGIQTTSMGFGHDYNENLLRSMAASGDGNHFFVESPQQLGQFFELELDGLCATLGSRVRLQLSPLHSGVSVCALGETEKNAQGQYLLSDIVAGLAMRQLFRVHIEAGVPEGPLLELELSWHNPREGRPERVTQRVELPALSPAERSQLPVHPEVEAELVVAMAAQARREAVAAMNKGEYRRAQDVLHSALQDPKLPAAHRDQLIQLKHTVDRGDANAGKKMAMAQSFSYSRSSLTLGDLGEELVNSLVAQLPLQDAPLLSSPATTVPLDWSRIEGMLAGLCVGESQARGGSDTALGEHSRLALSTLEELMKRPKAVHLLSALPQVLADTPMPQPSSELQLYRERRQHNKNLLECGVEAPTCGAMARIAPLILYPWGSSRIWGYVALMTYATHRDPAALICSLGWASLLLRLIERAPSPPPNFYFDHFVGILEQLELPEHTYASQAPRYDGWNGRLSEYLRLVIPDARRRGLSFEEAWQEWGSSHYLLESVPTVLYALEQAGHMPRQCLQLVVSGPSANQALGAMVGAALGALHGTQRHWDLPPTVSPILNNYRDHLGHS